MKPASHTWPLVSINRLTPFRNCKMVLLKKKKNLAHPLCFISVVPKVLGCNRAIFTGYKEVMRLFLSLFQSSRVHITRAVLEQFLSFAKYLDGLPHGAPLLKQLCDHVLFNPAIWIHTPAKVCSFFSLNVLVFGSVFRNLQNKITKAISVRGLVE